MANTWTMNETQKAFIEAIKEYKKTHADEEPTIKELEEIAGRKFATGSINVLVTKGIVGHADDKIVEETKIVKSAKKTWTLA